MPPFKLGNPVQENGVFLFGVIVMSHLKTLKELERLQEERLLEEKREHQCHNCVWGRWTGLRYYCPFARCINKNKCIQM